MSLSDIKTLIKHFKISLICIFFMNYKCVFEDIRNFANSVTILAQILKFYNILNVLLSLIVQLTLNFSLFFNHLSVDLMLFSPRNFLKITLVIESPGFAPSVFSSSGFVLRFPHVSPLLVTINNKAI